MAIAELQDQVIKILTTTYGMTPDEASEAVEDSYREKSHLWTEESDPEDLAKFLATDDDDE